MKFRQAQIGDYLSLQKGLSYNSSDLVQSSNKALLTINAFFPGGGFKGSSEKPYGGDIPEQYVLDDGDVLVAMTEQDYGLLASPLVVDMSVTPFEELTFSLDVARFKEENPGLLPQFVYNVLRIPAFRKRAAYGDAGSTVQRLPYEALLEQVIPIPPLEIQEWIINTIRLFDDKIQSNLRLISIFESFASRTFKSWFIDFDLVTAAAGASEDADSYSPHLLEIFPSVLEDTRLGPVIAGSEIVTVGQVLDLSWGDTKTTKASYVPNGYPAFSAKGQDGNLAKFDYDQMGIVLSAIGAGCGKTWLALGKWSCIKNTIRVLSKDSHSHLLAYFYFLSNDPDFWPKRGSAQPFIGQEDARSIEIVLPPVGVLEAFGNLVVPMLEQAHNLKNQNNSLEKLRDLLLPQLVCGDLEVPYEIASA